MKKTAEQIKRIGLIGNSEKPSCARVVSRAAKLIRATGRKVFCDHATAQLARLDATVCVNAAALARSVDLLLVFGGDGTMLRAAHEIAGSPTPMLGINIGGLGFLTAVPSDELERALKLLWRGEFKFERRALIEATCARNGRPVRHVALNDIVIGRGEVSRLIELEVDVNGDPLTRYRCDGLIVSSPTGSTAYSLAAGGAVVFPTAEVFALTPICPHTLSNRSLIVPLSATIRIKPISPTPSTILSADGQVISELAPGDTVTVRRSRHTIRLMQLADSSFFEALRRKLHWRGAYDLYVHPPEPSASNRRGPRRAGKSAPNGELQDWRFTTSQMIRLVDIAARVGVSVMTVSKALRDRPDVAAATRDRIKKAAQEMGYVPDSTALGLRFGATKLFGLVIPATTNPIFARIVLAVEERAYELGYDVLLMHTQNLIAREEACLRRLLSRRVDGIFVAPVYRMESDARIYRELQASKTPVVLLGAPAACCSQFVSVQGDDLAASFAATQHLLQLGHQRIAYFAGPLPAMWAQERFEGYRRAHRDVGLDVDDHLVFHAGSTIEDGVKAALQFVNEKCDATAVLAVNDLIAVGCANTLLQQGLRIPQDLSLVGFGNILLAEHFRIPLTTVRQPKFRLGSAAMDMMMQLIRGERVENRRLPAELILRTSKSAPRPA